MATTRHTQAATKTSYPKRGEIYLTTLDPTRDTKNAAGADYSEQCIQSRERDNDCGAHHLHGSVSTEPGPRLAGCRPSHGSVGHLSRLVQPDPRCRSDSADQAPGSGR